MTVFVDGENVRRSTWPNITPEELVELVRAWVATAGVRAVIVFDGQAPGRLVGERASGNVTLVGTGSESADDWLARAAGAFDGEFELVTSDRLLRARAGTNAARVVGGGTFARRLQALRKRG